MRGSGVAPTTAASSVDGVLRPRVLVADRRSKTEMLAAIETVLDDAPETSGRAELVLPQLTEVYRYRRTA